MSGTVWWPVSDDGAGALAQARPAPVAGWARVGPVATPVALAVLLLAPFIAFPSWPNDDAQYALLWGRDLLSGHGLAFNTYGAPAEHPLLVAAGTLLGPFGETGARAFVFLTLGSLLALVMAIWRLALPAAGTAGALIAAALVACRADLWLLAAAGSLDIACCALLAWAAVLAIGQPLPGAPAPNPGVAEDPAGRPAVWWLLTLAGLLRPEAWLLAGLYALAVGHSASRRQALRAAALAAVAPVIWSALDLVATGDPLVSLGHRHAFAVDRAWSFWAVLQIPLLGAAIAGFALAAARRERRLVVGWGLALACGAALATAHTTAAGAVAELRDRAAVRDDLQAVLTHPAVADHRRCGPVSVPTGRFVPEVRAVLALPEGQVIARSDRSRRPAPGGVALLIGLDIERRPPLTARRRVAASQRPPRGFALLTDNERFAAYGRC